MPTINDSVQYLKGVGPAFAKKFEKLGIVTIRDLLLCYPRKYIDYTQPYTVVSAPYDMDCCVRATVLQKEPPRRITGGRVMNRVLAADDSGILSMTWFNASYAANNLVVGETYYFEGRIGGTLTRREISHPLVRTEAQVAACPFVAVYPGTDGLPAARHASCAHAALAFADELTDPLPPELLTRYRMPTKAAAVRGIHAPQSSEELAAARRRLIFEELYLLQIGIFLLRSHGRHKTSAPMHPLDLGPFWRSLPYPPTGAQKRSTEEIVGDLCGEVPMNRLLLRVGVVLGWFGSGVYFFDLVGDLVHSPKGVLDALHLDGIDNDNVAIRVEVGMHRKHGQNLRPITCPCVTALVVIGNSGFAALRVSRYNVVDGCAEVGVGFGYDFCNADPRQRHSRNAPAILPAIHILILYRYAETYSHGHSAHAEGIPKA